MSWSVTLRLSKLQRSNLTKISALASSKGAGCMAMSPKPSSLMLLRHAAPMVALKRPADAGPGRPKGSSATHPIERDDILHFVWDPITHGNVDDTKAAADSFFAKHHKSVSKTSWDK